MRVCVIPARGQSKRLPRKNILPFHGRPMIAHSIEAAWASGCFNEVWVSTEDDEIRSIAIEHGATEVLMRPESLADDVSGTPEVMQHTLAGRAGIDFACCIYATAPMISPKDLREGLALLVYATEMDFSFGMGTEPPKDAGQWYWGRFDAWVEGKPLITPRTIMVPVDEDRVCDINNLADFTRAEKMYGRLMEK